MILFSLQKKPGKSYRSAHNREVTKKKNPFQIISKGLILIPHLTYYTQYIIFFLFFSSFWVLHSGVGFLGSVFVPFSNLFHGDFGSDLRHCLFLPLLSPHSPGISRIDSGQGAHAFFLRRFPVPNPLLLCSVSFLASCFLSMGKIKKNSFLSFQDPS